MERVSKSRYNPKAAESQALEIIQIMGMMICEETKVEEKNLTPFWNSANYSADRAVDVQRHFQIPIFFISY